MPLHADARRDRRDVRAEHRAHGGAARPDQQREPQQRQRDPVRRAAVGAERFTTFCPKVLAGIDEGRLPDTILDRAIEIRMKRKLRRARRPFRDRIARAEAGRSARGAGQWAADAESILFERSPCAGRSRRPRRRGVGAAVRDRRPRPRQVVASRGDAGRGVERPARRRRRRQRRAPGCSPPSVKCGRSATPTGYRARTCVSGSTTTRICRTAPGRTGRASTRRPCQVLEAVRCRERLVRITGTSTLKGYRREQFGEAWDRYLPPDSSLYSADVADVADVAANTHEGEVA